MFPFSEVLHPFEDERFAFKISPAGAFDETRKVREFLAGIRRSPGQESNTGLDKETLDDSQMVIGQRELLFVPVEKSPAQRRAHRVHGEAPPYVGKKVPELTPVKINGTDLVAMYDAVAARKISVKQSPVFRRPVDFRHTVVDAAYSSFQNREITRVDATLVCSRTQAIQVVAEAIGFGPGTNEAFGRGPLAAVTVEFAEDRTNLVKYSRWQVDEHCIPVVVPDQLAVDPAEKGDEKGAIAIGLDVGDEVARQIEDRSLYDQIGVAVQRFKPEIVRPDGCSIILDVPVAPGIIYGDEVTT